MATETFTTNTTFWMNSEKEATCRKHALGTLGDLLHIHEAEGDSTLNGPFFTSDDIWVRMSEEDIANYFRAVQEMSDAWKAVCDTCVDFALFEEDNA